MVAGPFGVSGPVGTLLLAAGAWALVALSGHVAMADPGVTPGQRANRLLSVLFGPLQRERSGSDLSGRRL